jgi:hypothetical protein
MVIFILLTIKNDGIKSERERKNASIKFKCLASKLYFHIYFIHLKIVTFNCLLKLLINNSKFVLFLNNN